MRIFSLLFFLKISSFHLITLKEKDILSSDYLCDKPGCPYLGISVLLECEKQKQNKNKKSKKERNNLYGAEVIKVGMNILGRSAVLQIPYIQ